ncbi:DUF4352 domain-containing protein [uncultured Subdoligranulum sp.]|uniref:DUF4352 domain-containing protein n=1 Tax=uncultured Subdoligranulum sp. TaxID=512298 RepID=UPI0025FE12CC|nr:DUF4352 domain-containing protein [uncultured Subdoligranulum sp.]
MIHSKMRRLYGVVTALFFTLLLAGCAAKSVQAQAGETVSTVLFDFTVSDPETLDSYTGIDIPDGQKLVQMFLKVSNTSDQTYTMFAEDFQIQWGEGDDDFGTCLEAVDDYMMPYSYQLDPGKTYSGMMLVLVPEDCTQLTVAYQEMKASGDKATAYFVEVPL